MLAVDWRNVTITFDVWAPPCQPGKHKFGIVQERSVASQNLEFGTWRVAVGDLNGDGKAEAVIVLRCHRLDVSTGLNEEHLAVVRRLPDGTLSAAAYALLTEQHVASAWVSNGLVHIDSRNVEYRGYRLGAYRSWRWRGTTLEPLPDKENRHGFDALDLSRVATRLACTLPAGSTLRFNGRSRLEAGGWRFSLGSNRDNPVWVELGRTGRPYLLLEVECTADGAYHGAIVLFDRAPNGSWTALDLVPKAFVEVVRKTEVNARDYGFPPAWTNFAWDGKAFHKS
jgi:hypothetical protein